MKKEIKLTQTEYDEILDRLIPFLNQFASKSGKEGCAYFIDNAFVVKSFINHSRQEQMSQFFENYVKEQQKFADEGYLLPRLYSYKIVNTMGQDGEPCTNFYILEDAFKGSDIFIKASDNFFNNFKRVYSNNEQSEFLSGQRESLYNDMETFINGFIMQNTFLLGMKDEKIDKLVLSVYKMFREGRYSVPDVHMGNLLVNKNGFNIIDNYMLDRTTTSKYLNNMKSEVFLTTRFLNIFGEHKKINDVFKDTDVIQANGMDKLYLLQQENMFYTQEVIKKLMRSIKRCISQNETLDLNLFLTVLRARLEHYVDKEQIAQIAQDVEMSF